MTFRWMVTGVAALTLAGVSSAGEGTITGRFVVTRTVSDSQSWLELRTIPATTARALTPRPVPGEKRTECCALFSPDGTKLAFIRHTQRTSKLLLLDMETGRLRTVVQRPGLRSWGYVWARDSRSLLHSTYDRPVGKVRRFPVDGPGMTISEIRSENGGTWPEGSSPDGSVALVVESEGESLYFHYEGPDVLYALGAGGRVKLASTQSIGGASWSPEGSLVAYTANCFSICNIEAVRPDGSGRRRLTRFATRTSPLAGYDELSFDWAGRAGEIVYGRGLTLHGVDAASGDRRRIATLPCPRRRCVGPSLSIVAVSRERDVAIVFLSDARSIHEAGTPADDYRLYQVSLLTGAFVAADHFEDADDIWLGRSP
ncbi:MAG: hypothetical protein M3R12_10965 [Actinomycetota bacterium]|nr:hypothetical protein [Actinomycetota bacterium]